MITPSEIVTVDEAGHWVHFDKPLETIELISQFIDQID